MFVIAHRGANRYAPQNTMEAFRKATELNADGIETDVRITKDGQLVLCHNNSITRTSNGKGKISDLSLEELSNYDFGNWFGSRYENTLIPTLDEFLREMKNSIISILNIELKPTNDDCSKLVNEIIDKSNHYGLDDRLLISSFDYGILEKVKSINPKIKTGYLYPAMGEIVKRKIIAPLGRAIRSDFDFLLPNAAYVTKDLIQQAHEKGIKVAVWTVNKIESVQKLYDWGVDGIITDYPDIIKNKIDSL